MARGGCKDAGILDQNPRSTVASDADEPTVASGGVKPNYVYKEDLVAMRRIVSNLAANWSGERKTMPKPTGQSNNGDESNGSRNEKPKG